MSIAISSLLSSLPPITPIAPTVGAGSASAGQSGNFASLMDGAIRGVEQPRQEANQAVQNLLNGEGEMHTVALAVQRADLAFDLGLQVRNKIVSAYQEVMKLQL